MSTRQITRQKIIMYSVVALMISTAVVYLGRVRGVERMFHFNQSGFVRHHIESNKVMVQEFQGVKPYFFVIVGVAYTVVAAWMLKNRRNSSYYYTYNRYYFQSTASWINHRLANCVKTTERATTTKVVHMKVRGLKM